MKNITIYHNPRCSKSRQALYLLEERNVDAHVLKYLDNPPSSTELRTILKKLNISAEKLVRKGEAIFKEKYKGKSLSEEEWISAMVEHPKLIERPIIISGNRAVIETPPELLLDIL